MKRPVGPKVAIEADAGSADSVAVRARVVRWNGWSWIVGSGRARSFRCALFSSSCYRRRVSKCWDPCHKHFLHLGRSRAVISHELVLMLHFLMLALRTSWKRFLFPPLGRLPRWEKNTCFGSLLSGIRTTWPAQRSCWRMITDLMLVEFVCERTLMLVHRSSHSIQISQASLVVLLQRFEMSPVRCPRFNIVMWESWLRG